MLTKQKAFDVVVKCAREQMFTSRDENQCLYRDPANRKCFIGMLIPDEFFETHPTANKMSLGKLMHFSEIRELGINEEHYHFYSSLQIIHDTVPPERWENYFIKFAKDWNLTVPKEELNVN